ncbi:MAG: hypothetical protein WD670_11020, partial [Actinomycetota bacterium]
MKKPRALWASIVFVVVLAVGGVALFVTGTRPVLGLDLEGGVSVILSAPEGTPADVMDQALENIRNRIDAFGTAEPLLFVTGTTLEVQIPGLARGTIEERAKTQHCIADVDGFAYDCFEDDQAANDAFEAARVQPVISSVCLTGDIWEQDAPCFGDEGEADDAIDAIAVAKRQQEFCLTGTGLETDPCGYPTRDAAEAALGDISTEVTQSFCIQGTENRTLTSDLGAACLPTIQEAQDLLDGMRVLRSESEFCVLSSADEELGCFLSRESAEARLQETGQERLLQVIGQTARLEQREVLQVL